MSVRICGILLAMMSAVGIAHSQSFEVASVRPYAPRTGKSISPRVFDLRDLYQPNQIGRIEFVHVSLRALMMAAWQVNRDQIQGPSWIGTRLYDISAAIAPGSTPENAQLMLRNLLRERFGLATHEQTSLHHGFRLVAGTGGLELAETRTGNETSVLLSSGILRMTNCTLSGFAQVLSVFMRIPVEDRTGATGNYDITLSAFATDLKFATTLSGSLKSVREALAKLGLRLEPATVPAITIVVDRADADPVRD